MKTFKDVLMKNNEQEAIELAKNYNKGHISLLDYTIHDDGNYNLQNILDIMSISLPATSNVILQLHVIKDKLNIKMSIDRLMINLNVNNPNHKLIDLY